MKMYHSLLARFQYGQDRVQTTNKVLNKLKSLFAYMVLLNEIGSENYSGKENR